MRLHIWRGFRLEVPENWEMLQFSREHATGRIAFADRYQFRLEFSWRVLKGRPEMRRLGSDYASKIKDEEGIEEVAARNIGPWHGVKAGQGETLTTRFGRYFPEASCLVELVMLWQDGLDAGVERKILDSVAGERQTSALLQRWRAFGMDLLASSGMALSHCGVDPAYARMVFAPAPNAWQEERFERLGMVREWLRTSVKAWLLRRLPKGTRIESERSDVLHGHEVEELRGHSFASGLARLLDRRRHHHAAAWICPADGRLYLAKKSGPEAPPAKGISALAGGRLSCCGDLGLTT